MIAAVSQIVRHHLVLVGGAARQQAVSRERCLFLLGLLSCSPAFAVTGNTFAPDASITYLKDDNFLRVADGAGKPGIALSDTVRNAEAGITINETVSGQLFAARAKLATVSFDRLSQLDYTGKDFFGSWNWRLGSHLSGTLAETYSEVLAPYTDIVSTARNVRTQYQRSGDIAWLFHPRWRIRAGISHTRYAYELSALQTSEHIDDAGEAGLDYLAANGSTVGLQLRRVKSLYAVAQIVEGQAIDNGNTQDEVKLKVDWAFSGITRIRILGGWVKRTHVVLSERDASGGNGRVIADWARLGKLHFTGAAWDEFGPVESSYFTNSKNKGASIAAIWQADDHFQASLGWRREDRDFEGEAIAASNSKLGDVTRGTTLSATYMPVTKVSVVLALSRDTRTVRVVQDAFGLKNYRSQSAALSASIQF